jgi:2-haloacid dehalogenase
MLDWPRFEWLSFDCYGTLIDWETGILAYLRPLLRSKGCDVSDAEILNLYSEFEPREQSGSYRSYREVLASVVRDFANKFRFEVNSAEAGGLAESLGNWRPFPDTVPGLRALKSRYRLAILSNIDDDLFALTAQHLQVPFDLVITAQQVRAYKPSRRNFALLLEQTGISTDGLLHVAESLYHDVVPARQMGISTVWVNRRQGKSAAATRLADAKPDLEVASIGALAGIAVPGK